MLHCFKVFCLDITHCLLIQWKIFCPYLALHSELSLGCADHVHLFAYPVAVSPAISQDYPSSPNSAVYCFWEHIIHLTENGFNQIRCGMFIWLSNLFVRLTKPLHFFLYSNRVHGIPYSKYTCITLYFPSIFLVGSMTVVVYRPERVAMF